MTTEDKVDERRLIAGGFLLFGGVGTLLAGIVMLLPYAWNALGFKGSLPFFVASACCFGVAAKLLLGDKKPVENLKTFMKGALFLAAFVILTFGGYGRFIGHFSNEPQQMSGGVSMILGVLVLLKAIPALLGHKKAEEQEKLAKANDGKG